MSPGSSRVLGRSLRSQRPTFTRASRGPRPRASSSSSRVLGRCSLRSQRPTITRASSPKPGQSRVLASSLERFQFAHGDLRHVEKTHPLGRRPARSSSARYRSSPADESAGGDRRSGPAAVRHGQSLPVHPARHVDFDDPQDGCRRRRRSRRGLRRRSGLSPLRRQGRPLRSLQISRRRELRFRHLQPGRAPRGRQALAVLRPRPRTRQLATRLASVRR